MSLDDLRRRIDAIDDQILTLLEQRAEVVSHVARTKQDRRLPVHDPEREREVLERLAGRSAGHFPREAIIAVYREIMSACLAMQAPVTVAFLGPEGTFSHIAARRLFGLAARYSEATTIEGVFDAVRRGAAGYGVVPIENTTEGSVTWSADALLEGGLFIRRELVLDVSHCLLGHVDKLTAVERVYSHPQALAQCRAWLAKNLASAQLVQTSSTAGAAREAAVDPGGAAIGSSLAGELAGLPVLRDNIQDRAENATRFVVLAREDAPRTGDDKTTLGFALRDEPGALRKALEIFDAEGVNLSRIESRPSRQKAWEYVFIVDLEGHRDDLGVTRALARLREQSESVTLLGSYPRHDRDVRPTRRRLEDEIMTAAYQGVEGAYSDVLLRAHFGARAEGVETVGLPTFRDVAMALLAGRARYGVLPLENTIAGTFREGYDLIAQYDLQPVREVIFRMDHRLLGVPGATLAGVRRIEGHPIVLEECGKFLATLPGARPVPAIDTGVAARDVAEAKDPSIAAIGPAEAGARYGLVELAQNLADHPDTFTRFLIVEAVRPEQRTPPETASRRTSVLFATAHEHGLLARCLTLLADAGINLSKLESRPKPGRTWEYMFYADFEGDASEPQIAAALTAVRGLCTEFRLLGSYDVAGVEEKRAPAPRAAAASVAAPPASMPAGAAKNWPKASRPSKPGGTQLRIGNAVIGGGDFVIIAGPCSVESREQVLATAEAVRARGAVMLRGGAFKPRTNPYAFQGLGWEGVDLLAEAGRASGLPTVSEVMSVDQVERMARGVDVLQIGARNMQNFDLLKAVGRTSKPIMLKRGLSATLDELLAAAEYILSEGNPQVMLCERGIRTFETATRNTLDLSAVPVLRERTHLPIIVDPSHGVGVRRWIRPLCRAAKAVGADGIIIEVHPNPSEAKSDADQALTFDDFEEIVGELGEIPSFGR